MKEILITNNNSHLSPASDFSAIDVVLTFTDDGPRVFEFPLEIFQDTIAEGNEHLFVRLSAAPGETGVTFARDYSRITILDDDGKRNNF